jgi:hypothetical protein
MRRGTASSWLRAAAALAAAASVAACGPQRDQFAPACPIPGLIRPLDQMTLSRGGSPALRDLAVRARIVDVRGTCEPGDTRNLVNVTVHVVADATRGPGLTGNSVRLPVFVAVTDLETILDKKLFYLPVTFPPNIDTARGTGPDIQMTLPVTPSRSAATYGIVAGFQLTPGELAAARQSER